MGVQIHSFLTSAIDSNERSASRPGRFTAGKERPVPMEYEDTWASEAVWSHRRTDKITYLLTCLLACLLTPWSRVLFEKLTVSQLVTKIPAFYGTRRFITASQVPATCPFPEPAQSSPCPPIPLPEDHLNTILTYTPGSSKWSLSLRFPHQNPVCTSHPSNVLHAQPISFCSI